MTDPQDPWAIPAFLRRARDPAAKPAPLPAKRELVMPLHPAIDRRPLRGSARDRAALEMVKAIGDGVSTFGKLRKIFETRFDDKQLKSALRRALRWHKIELVGRTYSKV